MKIFFPTLSLFIQQKEENLRKTDASVFKKADARFRKEVPPESVLSFHGPGGGNGVGVAGLSRG